MAPDEIPHWRTKGIGLKPNNEFDLNAKFSVDLPAPEETGTVASYGTPVTKKAAIKMIEEGYWRGRKEHLCEARNKRPIGSNVPTDEEKAILNEYLAVTFSKEILTFLLSQKDCAGIKFYFCTNPDGNKSLVLIGVDSQNNDLGEKENGGTIIPMSGETIEADGSNEKTAIFEVGGPKQIKDYISNKFRETVFSLRVQKYFDCPEPESKPK